MGWVTWWTFGDTVALLLLGEPAEGSASMASYTNSKTREIHHVEKFTGAQTNQEVIAAPATGYAILIHDLYWSSSADAEVYIEQGTTLVAGQYVAANSGREHLAGRGSDGHGQGWGGRELTNATNLILTTSAGNLYLEITYSVVAS